MRNQKEYKLSEKERSYIREYFQKNKRPFVYSFRNKRTGKTYYGASNTATTIRKARHLTNLRKNRHTNPGMQADFNHELNKESDWVFEILHVCKSVSQMNRVEAWYLINNVGADSCYNEKMSGCEPLAPEEL